MMKHVFEQALGINRPWFIDKLKFDKNNSRLDIYIDFEAGTKFEYLSKKEDIFGEFGAYDTIKKSWRHLNFFSA